MITKRLTFSVCVLVALGLICLPAGNLFAQSPPDAPLPEPTLAPALALESGPSVDIIFAGAKRLKERGKGGRFGIVGIRPNEAVDIQLQFSPVWANTPLSADALDGGKVSAKPKDALIAADGTASLRFQVGAQPGLYRVLITGAGAPATLKFWVADPENPKADPPVLTPNP